MHIAIVGGSIGGLATATALRRLGISVTVFERAPGSLEEKGAAIGRCDLPLWEFLKGEPMMRHGRRASRDQGVFYYGDLWKFWYDAIPEGVIKWNTTVTDLGNDVMRPTIDGTVYDAVIVADGGWSSLRRYVDGDRMPVYGGHTGFRLRLEKKDFPDFYAEGSYDVGRGFALGFNVKPNSGRQFIMGVVVIPMPESEITKPGAMSGAYTSDTTNMPLPDWFLPYVRRKLARQGGGQIVKWIELCHTVGKITPKPLYEFKANKVVNGRVIIIGDAAHLATPGTALGANTAVSDAAGLFEVFSKYPGVENIDKAIKAYESGGMQRVKELYQYSRSISRNLDYDPRDDDRKKDEL